MTIEYVKTAGNYDTVSFSVAKIIDEYENVFCQIESISLSENPWKLLAHDYLQLRQIDQNNGYISFSGGVVKLVPRSDRKGNQTYSISLYGKTDKFLERIMDLLTPYKIIPTSTIDWAYNTTQGMRTVNLPLKNNGPIHKEYYPFSPNIKEYMDNFLKSNSSILILNGPPGTGKTSIISNFISENALSAITTYDKDTMESDSFYLDFLTDSYDLILLEDADALLLSRLENRNLTLSKLLNVSDGIIDTSKKKIIITANLENKREIDPAVMRPGRCFGILDFRKLEGSEIDAVCGIIGKERPGNRNEYSLSECFNTESEDHAMKIGFS